MKSLTTKLILVISVLLLAVCGTVGIISYYYSSSAVVNEVNKSLQQLAEEGAMIVAAQLNAQINALEVLANNDIIKNPDIPIQDKMDILLTEAKRAGHIRMGIADLNGNLTSSNGAQSSIRDREYFLSAVAGTPSVSNPIVSKVDNSIIIIVAVPIYNDGQVNGVLVAIRDGNALSSITDQLVFGEAGEAYMISNDGTTIAHKNRDLVINMDNDFENVKNDPELEELVELEKKMTNGETGVGSYTYNGIKKYMGYAPVEGTLWSLAVTAPYTEIMAGVAHLRIVILILSAIVLTLGIIVTTFIARGIVKPLINAVGKIQEVAKGNLTIENIDVKTKDEVGILGNALNIMLDNLRALVKDISGIAEQVAASSEELSASSEQQAQAASEVANIAITMAQGAEKQSDAVRGITAAVEQSSTAIEQMAKNSGMVAKQTDEAATAAVQGQKAAEQAVEQIHNIGQSSSQVQNAVDKLAQSSKKINEIASVISDIADQTNLLALNAAIEAARAGEHGHGFAVVAEEVRKLAEQSQIAAKQIGELITQNQGDISDAITAMAAGTKDVELGIDVVNTAHQAFEQIANLANKVSSQMQEISVGIQQIAEGSRTIVDSVKDVEAISNENVSSTQTVSAAAEEQTASVEEISSASQDLATMAQELQKSISKFSI